MTARPQQKTRSYLLYHTLIWGICLLLFFPTKTSAQVEVCEGILNQGIRDEFDMVSDTDFRSVVSSYLSMSDEQIQQSIRSGNFDLGVSVPFAEKLFNLGVKDSDSSERIGRMQRSYRRGGFEEVDKSDYIWLTQRVVNQAIPAAWLRCIELTTSTKPPGVTMEIGRDVANQFTLSLRWEQTVQGQKPPVIVGMSTSGLEAVDPARFSEGTVLSNLQSRTQLFTRTDSAAASATIFFENYDDLSLQLPSLVPLRRNDQIQNLEWALIGVPLNLEIVGCVRCSQWQLYPKPNFLISNSGPNFSSNPHHFFGVPRKVQDVVFSFYQNGTGNVRFFYRIDKQNTVPEETLDFNYSMSDDAITLTPMIIADAHRFSTSATSSGRKSRGSPRGSRNSRPKEPSSLTFEIEYIANNILLLSYKGIPVTFANRDREVSF